MDRGEEILRMNDVTIEVMHRRRGRGVIAREVSLSVHKAEVVGLIGESGSGKTLTAKALLGLLPRGIKVAAGQARLQGDDLFALPRARMRGLRGDRLALIPQDALHSLNPVLTVGRQVGEPLVIHRHSRWRDALKAAVDLLRAVRVPMPERRAKDFPHQFSGGMQQRAMVATGLALHPTLVIADEPTTALDVTVQAQILELINALQKETETAFLFITHDLGIVSEICDWVYVMYAGEVVESGKTEEVFADPRHPYTRALLAATPSVLQRAASLQAIPGQIPSPFERSEGCRFADRCRHRFEKCARRPPLRETTPGRAVRCFLEE